MNQNEVLQLAKNCLNLELEGASKLNEIINENLLEICKIIANCKGKVVISGVGKSGHIGKKISSTMSSIGIPSFFMHPTEASHGDLGMLSQNDVIILISNSGESNEFGHLLEFIKNQKITSIGITRNKNSTLGNGVNYKIIIPQSKEVISYNAPTTSTTQTLIIGDILAICSSHLKNFTEYDYAKIHPGGKLGLSLNKISSIMREEFIACNTNTSVGEILPKMTSGLIIVAENGKVLATFTDGDLRRAILKEGNILNLKVCDFANKNPTILSKNEPIIKAVEVFNQKNIGSIVITDENSNLCGVIDRKDIEL